MTRCDALAHELAEAIQLRPESLYAAAVGRALAIPANTDGCPGCERTDTMRLDVYHHSEGRDEAGPTLDRILTLLHTMRDAIMSQFDDLKQAAGKLTTDVGKLLSDGQAASEALHTQLDGARQQATDLAASLSTVQADDDASKAALATAQQQITDLQAQIDAAKQAATDVTSSLTSADDAVTTADAALNPPATATT